jgi:hypothetical protein
VTVKSKKKKRNFSLNKTLKWKKKTGRGISRQHHTQPMKKKSGSCSAISFFLYSSSIGKADKGPIYTVFEIYFHTFPYGTHHIYTHNRTLPAAPNKKGGKGFDLNSCAAYM